MHIPQLAADIKVRMTLNEVERMHIPQLAADIKVRMTLNERERMHIPQLAADIKVRKKAEDLKLFDIMNIHDKYGHSTYKETGDWMGL